MNKRSDAKNGEGLVGVRCLKGWFRIITLFESVGLRCLGNSGRHVTTRIRVENSEMPGAW